MLFLPACLRNHWPFLICPILLVMFPSFHVPLYPLHLPIHLRSLMGSGEYQVCINRVWYYALVCLLRQVVYFFCIDFTWGTYISKYQIPRKDSTCQTHDAPGWTYGWRTKWSGWEEWRTARLNEQRLMESSARNLTEYLHQGGHSEKCFPTLCSPDHFTLGRFRCSIWIWFEELTISLFFIFSSLPFLPIHHCRMCVLLLKHVGF